MKRLMWLLGAVLTLSAFGQRLAHLLSVDAPTGTDGYYYVVQIEDWVSQGHLHVPDGSWVLRALALPASLGMGTVISLKAATAALAAAVVVATLWAARRGGLALGAMAALALWAAASPTLTHLSAAFPKNLGAVAPLIVALGALGAGRDMPWPRRLAIGIGAALLAATAHRVGAALALLAGVGYGLGLALRGVRAPDRRQSGVMLGAAFTAALAFTALAAALPGLLHPADVERLSGQFDLSWHVPPPWGWLPLRPTHPVQIAELSAPWLLGALGLWRALRQPHLRPALLSVLIPLGACLFPLWRMDTLDMGYRLSLMAPVLAIPLCCLLWRPAEGEDAHPPQHWPLWRWAVVVLAGVFIPLVARVGADLGDLPPYRRYEAVIAAIKPPLPTLLIAHQGINFLYDHVTGEEAMAWAPEPELPKEHIGRVVYGVREGEWLMFGRAHPDLPAAYPLDGGYWYCREDVWEALNDWARGDDELIDRLEGDKNPSRVRPSSLTRGR